jgi:hypothetical protein
MATKTLGTNAQTTLTAVQWNSAMSVSDLAAINALMKFPVYTAPGFIGAESGFIPTPCISQGVLYLPGGKGQIKLDEGDWIGVDPNTGWPIHLTKDTAGRASWVHT